MGTESFSLWEMGRSDNRFSSMTPHVCPQAESLPVGTVSIGLQALSVVAQFGLWLEFHKANRLAAAQFEERRLLWLDQMLEQWIAEHQDRPGVKLDVTLALCQEANKLMDSLVKTDLMDVPQVLLLKAGRVADYLDLLSSFWCAALGKIVRKSRSDRKWLVRYISSSDSVANLISQARDEHSDTTGSWMMGALGLAALFIPVVGPAVGGGLLGGAIGDTFDRRSAMKHVARLESYPELLRLPIATDALFTVAAQVKDFLDAQRLGRGTVLYGLCNGRGSQRLFLGPATANARRKTLRPGIPELKCLPAPKVAA